MKKLLLSIALVISASSFLFADDWAKETYGVPRSTIVTLNEANSCFLSTTGIAFLSYYQVLTTGTAGSQLDIYDGRISSATAVKSYLGFPVSTFYPMFPLDITISSGTIVVMRSAENVKIRLLWHQIYRYLN